MNRRTVSRMLGAGGLLAIAGVHANWASGSAWPAPTHAQLTQAVIGGGTPPSSRDCAAVAAALTVAAAVVAGMPGPGKRAQRVGALGVAGILGLRGLVGLAGMMPQEKGSSTFRRWNRRLYSPLCLVLAALCAASSGTPCASPHIGDPV